MKTTASRIFSDFITENNHISIIQAENPDGDSLGSALALHELLDNETTLYCPVQIPKYLHYLQGYSLVEENFDFAADGYIIVDTSASLLLQKTLSDPTILRHLSTKPVLVIDHHSTPADLPFEHQLINQQSPAVAETITKLILDSNLSITPLVAEYLYSGIAADTLGLTSASTTADTFRLVATLIDCGLNIEQLENRRHEFLKKTPRIFSYKADLIKRTEYYLDNNLAIVHIPWEDIKEYSNDYNPGSLILEELRFVEGVKVAIAVKTYPDGKITGKIRTTLPIAEQIAGFFGGGGHAFASGFKTYDSSYQNILTELIPLISDLLRGQNA